MKRDPEQKVAAVRNLSRREMLGLMGSAAAAVVFVGCGPEQSGSGATTGGAATVATGETTAETAASCTVRPEQTEGPYFVDEMLNRSDIRVEPSDGSVSEGIPLDLTFKVSRADGSSCVPLAGALVDIWQCDALGQYSDVEDNVGKKFLRGYQVTDQSGTAQFTTIYPGWYRGRAVHIHFKIRDSPESQQGYEFTSQLYFDDALTDEVHSQQPYAEKGARDRRNSDDGIYGGGGNELTLQLTPAGEGYAGTFDIALDTTYG